MLVKIRASNLVPLGCIREWDKRKHKEGPLVGRGHFSLTGQVSRGLGFDPAPHLVLDPQCRHSGRDWIAKPRQRAVG